MTMVRVYIEMHGKMPWYTGYIHACTCIGCVLVGSPYPIQFEIHVERNMTDNIRFTASSSPSPPPSAPPPLHYYQNTISVQYNKINYEEQQELTAAWSGSPRESTKYVSVNKSNMIVYVYMYMFI